MFQLPKRKVSEKAAQILTDDGQSLIDIEMIYRMGDKLCMQGKLMGQFPASVYLSVGSFYRLLAMLLRPAALSFTFLSSFYWLRGKFLGSKVI
jgi:hypothetical protein